MRIFTIVLCGLLVLVFGCEETDPHLAKAPSPDEQVFYDFFNDIRLETAAIADDYPQLEGWMSSTKTYLEKPQVQRMYTHAGLYFERNKNREQGAAYLENRFRKNGLQYQVVIYPLSKKEAISTDLGADMTYGKAAGKYFIYYQIFTANPVNKALEEKLKNIIEERIQQYEPKFI